MRGFNPREPRTSQRRLLTVEPWSYSSVCDGSPPLGASVGDPPLERGLTRQIETFIQVTMAYKRNQVEEAISHLLDPKSLRSTQDLRTKVKRLLDTDRALPPSAERHDAKFAFFGADPPGKGVENWFSAYEAFALLNGVRLMGHGWPQGLAVSVIRGVRPELEKQHRRILAQDPAWLFDQEAIRNNARPGDPAFDNQDPVLLTVVSDFGSLADEGTALFKCKICRGRVEAYKFFGEISKGQGALTMFDVTSLAHQLVEKLAKTEPRSRGRG